MIKIKHMNEISFFALKMKKIKQYAGIGALIWL